MSGAFLGLNFADDEDDSLDTEGAGACPARDSGAIITAASSTRTLLAELPDFLGLLNPALALEATPRLGPFSSMIFNVFMPFLICKKDLNEMNKGIPSKVHYESSTNEPFVLSGD